MKIDRSTKEVRQALRQFTPEQNALLEFLEQNETLGFINPLQLCAALAQEPVIFFTFSCLVTERGKEELKLDLFETLFLKKFLKRSKKFFAGLA